MNRDSYVLFYKTKASKWVEALPLGNGKIGAMMFGGGSLEKISLNYDELWSGYPRSYTDMFSYSDFAKARDLALNGELLKSQDILEERFTGLNTENYLPLGDILIEFFKGGVKNYRRELDLSSAVHTVTYQKNDVNFKRETFISHPDAALVSKITSDKENSVNFKLKLKSKLRHSLKTENDALVLDGLCPSYGCANIGLLRKRSRYENDESKKGISFRALVKVKTDGEKELSPDEITVKNASFAIVYFTVESSFNGFQKHPNLEGKEYKNAVKDCVDKVYNKDYEEVKKDHIEDYRRFYNRVSLDLGSSHKESTPTDKRLNDFHSGKEDKSLYTLFFNFGRYLLISASREGSQCMNLQGIWNDSLDPPWSSNYTININTEMNYFPALSCNLAEMNLPLVELVRGLSVTGEKTAKDLYHARGFVSHHNTDIWRLSTPVSGKAQWSFWPLSSGWLCRHLFEHYEYANDISFLRNTAYPIMIKAASFYLDMLVEDRDGYLIMAPSTSPENSFKTKSGNCSVSQTTTMTASIIKELFLNCVKASEILDENPEIISEIKEKLPRLLPIRIGKNGDIMEWYEDEEGAEKRHRHVSHLYGLYPSRLINYDDSKDLINAAKKTLEMRGDDGAGWSLGWKINFYARLFDGNHALKLLDMQLRPAGNKRRALYSGGGGAYPNLFDAHPPFQIDGNFGALSGVIEMLLQSDEDKIYLLPALPAKWREGSVEGLLAKGNIEVAIEWENGKLKNYSLKGDVKNKKIIYDGKILN